MGTRTSSGRMELEFISGKPQLERQSEESDGGNEFRILVLADFSGRASRGVHQPLIGRKPVKVDNDTLGQVMAKYGVEIQIPVGAGQPCLAIHVKGMDDFHPDALFSQLPIFAGLTAAYQKLSDPATASAALTEVRTLLGLAGATPPVTPPPPPVTPIVWRLRSS